MTRWSRDPVTGESVKVPANMTYERWLALQEDRYGGERIEAAQKMAYNKSRDRAQFKRYQQLLGRKQMPPSVEKFQKLKYFEPDEWEELKAKYAEELRKKKKRKSE